MDRAVEELKKKGFSIIKNVISSESALQLSGELKAEANLPHMAHSKTMWYIRQLSALRTVFEAIWKTNDLIVSFDGATLRAPFEEPFTIEWHTDQDHILANNEACECLQGVLALSASGPLSGGTCLLPKSHKHFKSLMARNAIERKHSKRAHWQFVSVPDTDAIFRQCLEPEQPSLDPGDLLLWDSRCVHSVPFPNDPATERCVAYICMVPTQKSSENVLKARRRAYERGVSSTHWPHMFVDRGDERSPPNDWNSAPLSLKRLVVGNEIAFATTAIEQ